MTSNVGAEDVTFYRQRFQSGWRHWLGLAPNDERSVIDASLDRQFDPEFLNRIDRILCFERLQQQWLLDLLDIELEKLTIRLQRQSINLQVDQFAKVHLCRHFNMRFGARDIARRIRTELEPALARSILSHPEHHAFAVACTVSVLTITPL